MIRYDHRDTGRTTSYAPGQARYTVEDLADDAVGVLDGHELDRAHLVGMSLGGYLSQLIALKHPSRALTLTLIASERLALADPELPTIDPSVSEYRARAAELDWSDRDAVVAHQVGAWRINSGSAHACRPSARWPRPTSTARPVSSRRLPRRPRRRCRVGRSPRRDRRLNPDRPRDRGPVLPYPHALALEAGLSTAILPTLEGSGHELHRADWPTILDAVARHTAPQLRDLDRFRRRSPRN
jgi:pimeloyl-ACP methyl ester carboxylesterase